MSEAKLEAYFFTAVFIAVVLLTGVLFYPFLGALALAVVLASLSSPLYDRIHTIVRRRAVAAFIVVILITLAVLVPATGIFFLLLDEVQGIAERAASVDLSAMPALLSTLQAKLHTYFPMLASFDVSSLLQTITQNVGGYLAGALTSTAGAVLKLFVAIIALFYLLIDGHKFVAEFIKLSPLTDDEDQQIVDKLKAVSRSLIRGTLVIACLQGALVGIGFAIFGVPNPILWGCVGAVGALLPTIGTGIVMIPAVIYLVVTGDTAYAILLTAWGFLIVGLIDNILGPRLIGSGARIHPLFVLLSVLGGLSVFGMAGFLLGPLIFGLLIALSEIYKVKIREIHHMSRDA